MSVRLLPTAAYLIHIRHTSAAAQGRFARRMNTGHWKHRVSGKAH